MEDDPKPKTVPSSDNPAPPEAKAPRRVTSAPPPPTFLRGVSSVPALVNANAPWSTWSNIPRWKLYEGVALSLNIDPDLLSSGHQGWTAPRARIAPATWDEFNTRLKVATRNVGRDGAFATAPHGPNHDYTVVGCGDFVSFALRLKWPVPDEFSALAPQEQVAERPQTVDDPRLLKTFQRMILGMAISRCGFDPKAEKSEAPAKIADALLRHGLVVGSETVAKRLREAAKALSEELKTAPSNRIGK